MEIPWQRLSDEVLDAVIEEFVSREGTEYGAEDYTLAEKVAQVRLQLKRGEAVVDFDPDTETCHLIASH
ncbi:YheU family protein [Pseudohongiella sp.]|uniref:YheU family protein n=1 Tax=marine sediment metagenome TaxID=412755 RepID=A0A0F9W3T0_9ZZZZ|nr:YheU family protein [Pseudohongiella sp.]HDZ08538.1 YheU family protein [Pseudohongiella sp.]HEA61724.1 YheU family protein [Pseudohongiella sp.]